MEAALYATTLGHEVTVLERGRVGENLTRWGHVSLFSPWRMNHTPLGKRVLESTGVRHWPDDESYQTGFELLRSSSPASTRSLNEMKIKMRIYTSYYTDCS